MTKDKAANSSPINSANPRMFVAFMVTSVLWKSLILAGLLLLRESVEAGSAAMWWWMVSATVCAGFLDVGAILGLAYVDKFVVMADKALSKPE